MNYYMSSSVHCLQYKYWIYENIRKIFVNKSNNNSAKDTINEFLSLQENIFKKSNFKCNSDKGAIHKKYINSIINLYDKHNQAKCSEENYCFDYDCLEYFK
ncbi:hypothetical protein PCYB_104270 [Plasmodium cynomolgi strain B]|uniref:CYIR protein n=1 Tax=Plasmodium cynomolgi (strain B) TaxID=1120755 RepID=K6VCZ8_PLACD|nr:hypothetical protein PCYB_104270 [Plasmodium cynomolgi strain B]GAB67077.1 hypothetical protein PCYB_104270 [Plasmodium cynomolgi strain B]